MKKYITFVAGVALSATVLAACGGSAGVGADPAEAAKFVGDWGIKSIIANGEELNLQELFAAVGKETEGAIGLNLEENGKATLQIPTQSASNGTWKVSGNDTVIVTIDGDDETVTLKDGNMIMSHEQDGNKLDLVFSK